MRGSRVRVPLVALFSIPKHKHYTEISEISTSVVHGLPKPVRRVRLPYLAPPFLFQSPFLIFHLLFIILYIIYFIILYIILFFNYFISSISSSHLSCSELLALLLPGWHFLFRRHGIFSASPWQNIALGWAISLDGIIA